MSEPRLQSHIDDNDISKVVVDCAFRVHRALGPGLLENAYEECLSILLNQEGIPFQRQVQMPLVFEKQKIGTGLLINFNTKMFKDGIKRFVL